MAFEDSMIGSSDFDPARATEDLIRHVSDGPLPANLNINDLNTRLARKINAQATSAAQDLVAKPKTPLDLDGFEPISDEPAQPAPEPVTDTAQPLDTSGLEPLKPPVPAKPLGVGGNLLAAAKGVPHGAIEGVGSILKGAGAMYETGAPAQGETPNVDVMGNQTGFTNPPSPAIPTKPLHERDLYKAGQTVQDTAQSVAPMSDQEKASLGGQIGQGVGGVAPYLAAGAINPVAGLVAGSVGMGLQSAGDAYEEALKKGASEEVAAKVANLNGLAGAALGGLPIASVLRPISFISPAIAGKAAVMLNDAIQSGVIFASVGEAQQYIAQKIAKDEYDPNAGYSLDTQRVLASFITGSILGGAHHLFAKDEGQNTQNQAGNAQPGTGGPAGGGPSSPEDIAAFNQRARDTNPNPPPPETPPSSPDADNVKAFNEARETFGGASMNEILRQAGWMDEPIRDMTDEQKVAEVIKAAKEKVAKTGKFAEDEAPNVAPDEAASRPQGEPKQAETAPDVPHADYAVLREYGYSDEDIANMNVAQRKREVSDALAEGIKPDVAMQKYPKVPQGTTPTGAPVDRAGAAGTRTQGAPEEKPTTTATGTRHDPIVPQNAADVAAAQPVEPKSTAQAEAENYQHAHVEIPHLGLTGAHSVSIETGKGQVRKGVGPDGKPWEVKLPFAYGRIKGTKGADGQPLDIMIGDHPTSPHVFVIDQHHPKGAGFDEHKIMAGFPTPQDALRAYGESYDDKGGDRIGGATALTPEQFQTWYKSGATTTALSKKPPSSVPVKADEGGVSSTEAPGDASVPKGSPVASGAEATRPAESTHESPESSVQEGAQEPHKAVREGEVTPSSRVTYEPAAAHHQQIEAALGADYHRVAEVDIQRAAEILSAHEGMDPAAAFGQAVIENAVDQKFITHEQAEQAYGEEVKDVLDAGREGASGSSAPAEPERAASEQERAGGAAEDGVVSGGGETRPSVERAETGEAGERESGRPDTGGERAATEPETTEQPAAGGNETAGHEAGNAAEHEPAAETANNANYTVDNPGGDWLLRKQADALEDARNKQTRGATTAHLTYKYASGQDGPYISLPTDFLVKNTKGMRDEVRRPGDPQFDALLKKVQAEGWSNNSPIKVRVNHLGNAYVPEGNTRIAVAKAIGQETVPVEVDWQNGAERVMGPWHPSKVLPMVTDAKVTKIKPTGGPKPKPEAVTEAEEKAKIEDAGEKIGGARKDAWIGRGLSESDLEGMTGAERDKNLTKHNIWQRPDYVAAVADGVDPVAAALIKRLYDRLPVKPNIGRTYGVEQAARAFIKSLNVVRDAVKSVKTVDDAKALSNVIEINLPYGERGVLYPKGARSSPFYFDGADLRAAQRAVEAGFPEMAPWTRLFEVREVTHWNNDKGKYEGTGFAVYRKSGGRSGEEYKTRDEAEVAAKAAYDALGDERKKGGEEPKRPHLDNIVRDGPDYRKGKDVDGNDFVKDFGFRGVEFGNYVAGDERQKVVNLAYDALHDLARSLNVPPKALSLDGTLSVAFGARGRGGRAAAHYEAGRTVINMTKLSGAGSLAHEWGHALDHYLGELNSKTDSYKGYGTGVRSISGWDNTPKHPSEKWSIDNYRGDNRHLPVKLRVAVNRLMHDLFNIEESDNDFETRAQREVEAAKRGQQSWMDHLRRLREAKAKGGSSAGMKEAETQVEVWGRTIARRERALEEGQRKRMPSEYLREATKLSGATGDYWRRPNELFARSFEAYVYDKIKDEGFQSDYLVQGVEPNRFGNGFKGNPYPAGEERQRINADYDRVVRAIAVGEGKLGAGTRIQSAEGEPEPVESMTRVKRPVSQPSAKDEADAVAAGGTLPGAFEQHFTSGGSFAGILEARKFAKDKGFEVDPKQVEEAIELAMVKTARKEIEGAASPKAAYRVLVELYKQQPRLGTRTSTSVRDQAYSTPVPLAYVAARLAHIDKDTTVYEPTAGNGALLITADPAKVMAVELNHDRMKNLHEQGIKAVYTDATTYPSPGGWDRMGKVDAVIANPPFGAVKEGAESKVFDLQAVTGLNYKTTEIDQAIALHALDAMKDDGRAVLILGGVNKMVSTPQGRADAYQGQSKRLFYKALYDAYRVEDHFTVDGSLYERQGAAWPVDVVVINGRGKSPLPLPAVTAPRIYRSWDELGGLIDGQQAASGVRPAGDQTGLAPESGPGLEGVSGRDRVGAGGERSGVGEPAGVRGQSEPRAAGTGEGSGVTGPRPEGRGQGDQPARSGEQPPLTAAEIGDIFDDLIGKKPSKGGPRAEAAPRDERSTPEVAKSAAKKVATGADRAMQGLTDLFGGGKTVGMGVSFDEDTYQKAKPMFKEAVENFGEAGTDIRELMRRLIDHLKAAYKWTTETLENAKDYIVRFIQDVQSGAVRLGPEIEPEPARKEALKGAAVETDNQVSYKPQSKVPQLDTLAPVNMAEPMADSLRKLEARVGPVDKFVADELGVNSNQLATYFGAEQVDALGLAIDNIKRGKGFIIGDQTGIGKGRVNAAIIRWAIKNDRVPVFVTEKPGLYKDMFRDMEAVGMSDFLDKKPRILATNAGLDLPLEEGNGAAIRTGDAKEHNKHLMSVLGDLGKHYDMVFSTYSQMQTQKGEDTARRQFLQQLAHKPGGIVVIFDESHNAGGQTKTRKEKDAPADRAEFARDLVKAANGVFYSSATYAKRPEVMDLYSATDMSMAVDNLSDLAEAISHGRIPMQQAVASMLARGGQYMRRERSFAGINYNTKSVPVDRETYDKISTGLSAINELSAYVKAATTHIDTQIRATGDAIGADNSVGESGASSTNFTSVMHNVINQMLLAMKAEQAASHAIELIKRGEKPVLTVANTMEAFMKDYSDQIGVKPGEEIPADFGDVLQKYLDRTRTILIKKPFRKKGEKPERHYLTDEELGPAGVAVYNRAKAIIKGMDLSGLPISPIDYIKGRLKKAGYDTGEITGRTLAVDYTGNRPIFSSRPGSERTPKGKVDTLKRFNTRPKKGGLHALIINQSGSTGLSAHASVDFDDQSKRHMMIVQPEGNIDTHMQLLGRINRTGQVVLPEYTQLNANIPAEIRPASVLAKKMASLNANTTASRDSAVTSKDALDFLNEYGDQIAVSWLADNFEMHHQLGNPVKMSETGKFEQDDAMRKVTGRLPLLRLAQQEAIYDEFGTAYRALIDQLEAAGENALEAKSLDLKAKLLEKTEVQGKRNDSGSPFASPVYIQKVSVARLGKPFTPGEVIDKIGQALDPEMKELGGKQSNDMLANILKNINDPYSLLGKKALEKENTQRRDLLKAFDSYMRPIIDDEETPEARTKKMNQLNEVKDRWSNLHRMLPIGRRVVLKTDSGNLTGIVLDVHQRGEPKNPLALGTWNVKVAIADATRQITVPFSRLYETGKANPDSALDIEVEPMTPYYERPDQTLDRFQHMQTEAREDRYIAGGNMLAAYDWLGHKGAIINYTSDKGAIHQGILTARGFDPGKQAIAKGRVAKDPKEIRQYLDANPSQQMLSKDGNVGIQKDGRYGEDYVVTAQKAKAKGGKYYLDKALTSLIGDFSSKSGNMVGYISPRKFDAAIQLLQKAGAEFKMASSLQKPEAPKEGEEPTLAQVQSTPTGGLILTPDQRTRIEAAATAAMKAFVGNHVRTEFASEPMPLPGDAQSRWGGLGERAMGLYRPWQRLVQLALTHDLSSHLAHEAYHVIEYQLQTPAERALMERETPRIREGLKRNNRYNLTPDQVEALDGVEVRAIGFEQFIAGDRLDGVHVGIKRWYQKLWDALKALAKKVRGIKPDLTADDIYEKARSGGYADASGDTPRPEAMGPVLAAIRPGGNRSNQPPPPSETIAEHLRDRGYDRMAGVSQRLGIGKINTTEVRVKLQDKFLRVKNAEQSVDPQLPSNQSTYQAESLYHGRAGERLEALERDRFDPLIRDMHARDVSPGELNEYLYAMHAPERNAYIDSINPNLGGAGSGMTDSEAADILNRINRGNRRADFDALGRQVKQIIDETRDTMVAYGLISQETADAWAAQYQNYAPLRGFAEGTEDEGLIGRGRGYDTRGKEARPAFGRKSMADGPLQYIMMQAEAAIVRGEKNRVGNTFLRFVRSNPDPDRWQVNAPTLKRRIDARTGLVTHYADFNYHNEPDAFVTKIGGKPMVIRLYGREGLQIARALKQIGAGNMSAAVGVLHSITSLQSRLSTQYNPNFLLPNFVRDFGEAFINLQAQDQQRFVTNFVRHIPGAMKGAFAALRGAGQGDRYADAFREFDKAGGRIRFFGLGNVENITKNVSRKMRKMEGGAINGIRGAGEAAANGLEIVNGSIENGTRLAAYMAARDAGMTAPDAAMLARNLTVDFNKKGEWGPAINALYMFGNAQIQGAARNLKALGSSRVRRAAYALAAMGALGAFYNLLAGGEDDAGDSYYSKIPAYIRDKNMIFMWPKGMGHDGKYIKVPLPFGFSPFHVIGDRAMGVGLGKDKVPAAAGNVLGSIADAFNPLGEESSPWMELVPSLLRPGIHIATNKNWTGNAIYPDHDYDKTRPDSTKSFKSNSDFSKGAAAELNSLSGGSPYQSGWFDVHPGSIDHVLETISGGVGKFVMDVVKTGGALIKGEPFDETHAPILRRFVGSANDPQSDASAYYQNREEARKAGGENLRAARSDLRTGTNRDEAESFINNNPDAVAEQKIFKRADRDAGRVRKDATLSEDDKREQIRAIQNAARKEYREYKQQHQGASP